MKKEVTVAKAILALLTGTAIGVLIAYGFAAHALVTYPPAALIGTGDITSDMILNGTIQDVDVSSSSPLSIFKIGQVSDGAVPFGLSGRLNASTTLLMVNSGVGTIGVATTSASSTLSVQGNLLVSGNLTSVSSIAATGTIGIGTTSPSASLAVQGNVQVSGTSSVGVLVASSSINVPLFLYSATSTFTSGVSAAGLSSSQGLTISGNSLLDTASASSTFTGGLSVGSLSASAGLTLTGGAVLATGLPVFAGKLGIATTSPPELGVQGNLLVSGTTTTANLVATGTLALNGVQYVFPTAQGANTNVLSNNGAGILSWAAGATYPLLGSTTVATASTSVTVTLANNGGMVNCRVYIAGMNIADTADFQINKDGGTNYYYQTLTDNIVQQSFSGYGKWRMIYGDRSDNEAFDIDFSGNQSASKIFHWAGEVSSTTAGSLPLKVDGVGQWNNSTSTINQIYMFSDGGNTFNTGTNITCYGSPN